MQYRRHSWAVALMAVPIASVVMASDPDAGRQPSLDDLSRRIEQLERDNAGLRTEVDDLRAENQDGWLTEQRASEIRALVSDVLADADSRASLQTNGMTAGWGEHFFLASPDGKFKLELEGQMQFRWVYNFHDQPDRNRQGFENTRTRLTFRGHVFEPDITYLVRGGFDRGGGAANTSPFVTGGNFQLLDAWIGWQFNDNWTLKFGQFKLPFNREELVPSQYQLAAERSLVNENLGNIGRSQGFEVEYRTRDFRAFGAFSDGGDDNLINAGNLVGTPGANTTALSQDVEWAVTLRGEHKLAGNWDQFNDFTSPGTDEFGLMIGYAFHAQQDEYGTAPNPFIPVRDEEYWYAGTVDVSAEWGGANAFAAFSYHYLDDPTFGVFDIYGVVVQGGIYLTPKIEIFGRFEFGGVDVEAFQFSDLYVVTAGVNYYLQGHDLKWTSDLGIGISQVEGVFSSDLAGWRTDAEGAEPQAVFRTQFQLLF